MCERAQQRLAQQLVAQTPPTLPVLRQRRITMLVSSVPLSETIIAGALRVARGHQLAYAPRSEERHVGDYTNLCRN